MFLALCSAFGVDAWCRCYRGDLIGIQHLMLGVETLVARAVYISLSVCVLLRCEFRNGVIISSFWPSQCLQTKSIVISLLSGVLQPFFYALSFVSMLTLDICFLLQYNCM